MTPDQERWAEALAIERIKGADAPAYIAKRIATLATADVTTADKPQEYRKTGRDHIMLLKVFATLSLLASAATSASAATTTIYAQAGTPGVDFTGATFRVDSTIGAESGFGFRNLNVTGDVFSVLGRSASPYGGSRGGAYVDATGYQHVFLIDTFSSPFFPRADYSGSADIEFTGAAGTLFRGNELILDTLTNYFVGGTVRYAPGSPAIILSLPELGTWMMMIVGLGVIGTVLRRRRVLLPGIAS